MRIVNQAYVDSILNYALNIYHYGSFVYGTFQPGKSDYDFIVIVPNHMSFFEEHQFECDNKQYTIHTEQNWQEMLDRCDVDAIESYFLPTEYIVKESKRFHANITKEKIRNSFSAVASNSFVKCKKKLEVAESFDPNVGRKSLWHSLRIIDFGIQILEYGRIINYDSMNHLYDDIVLSDSTDWEYFKLKYKPIYNKLKTQFRACEREV